ncbi:MAG: hypothetical protein KGI79_03085 [Patescibacteria group bacterium]|nr:hypothetical protein [Patescibacteria group bacterium]MDE2116834.1 hypothetical protein [Patescibacteria group bacterium]
MKIIKMTLATVIITSLAFVMGNVPAFASVAAVSFGSNFFLRYPCTCTGGSVWYFVIPPTATKVGAGPIAYVVGSQARSDYDLPYGRQILGLFNPELTGECWMGVEPYCTVLPTRGTVLPMVGNSI